MFAKCSIVLALCSTLIMLKTMPAESANNNACIHFFLFFTADSSCEESEDDMETENPIRDLQDSLHAPTVSGTLSTPAVSGTLRTPAVSGTHRTPAVSGTLRTPAVSGTHRTPAVSATLRTPAVSRTVCTPPFAGTQSSSRGVGCSSTLLDDSFTLGESCMSMQPLILAFRPWTHGHFTCSYMVSLIIVGYI